MEPIVTERLILRSFLPTDWQDLYDYLSDEQVVRHTPYEVFTRQEARRCARERADDPRYYAVVLKKENKLIGDLFFAAIAFDAYELDYMFHRRYWSHGYALESARALINQAFAGGKVRRIIARCNSEHTASWRLLEKLAMRREGHFLQECYFKTAADGAPCWCDTYQYALLRSEWEQRAF